MSKCHIGGNHMPLLEFKYPNPPIAAVAGAILLFLINNSNSHYIQRVTHLAKYRLIFQFFNLPSIHLLLLLPLCVLFRCLILVLWYRSLYLF